MKKRFEKSCRFPFFRIRKFPGNRNYIGRDPSTRWIALITRDGSQKPLFEHRALESYARKYAGKGRATSSLATCLHRHANRVEELIRGKENDIA